MKFKLVGTITFMSSRMKYHQTFPVGFPRMPPLPPNEVQIEERRREPQTFKKFYSSFKKLFRINGFTKHSIAYGIIIGVLSGISTLLNQFILHYFPVSKI